MKTLLLPLAASAMLFGSAALADAFVDGVVNNLRSLGYEYIEVTRGVTQARAEAVRGTQKIEVIYDLATGQVLRREYELAGPGYFGRSGVEIDSVRRDFLRNDGRRSSWGHDDNDDDDDDGSRSSWGRDDNDDDDDDGSRRSSGRDDNDDDDDGGRSGGSSGSSGSGGGSRDDNDDD
jgi:uncharacterized membrane protein YgcG